MKQSIASSVLFLSLLSWLLVSNACGFIPNNNNNDVTRTAAHSTTDGNYYPGTPALVRDRINVDGKPVMSVNEYPPRSPVGPMMTTTTTTTRMGYANAMGTPPPPPVFFDYRERSNYHDGRYGYSYSLPIATMHRNNVLLSGPEYPKEIYTAMPTMVMSSSAETVRYPHEKYLARWMVNYDDYDHDYSNHRGTPVFNRRRIDVGSNRPVMSLGDYYSTPNSGAYEVKNYASNAHDTRRSWQAQAQAQSFHRQRSHGRRNRPMMSLGRAYQNYNNELRNPYGNKRSNARSRNSVTSFEDYRSMPTDFAYEVKRHMNNLHHRSSPPMSNDFAYEVNRHMNNLRDRSSPSLHREAMYRGIRRPITSLGYHSQDYQNYYDELQNPNSSINRGTPVFNRERIDMGSNKPVMSLGN